MKVNGIFMGTVLLTLATLTTVGSSLAYFTDSDVAQNVITTGKIGVTIREYQNQNGQLVPYQNPKNPIVPGDTVSKIVRVQNTGSANAYIRAKIEVDIPNGQTLPKEMIHMKMGTDWRDGGDGYYYYQPIVKPNEMTTDLFSEVTLSTAADNRFAEKNIHIGISAEGIQSDNNESGFAFSSA